MNRIAIVAVCFCAALLAPPLAAQDRVLMRSDHEIMLASPDPITAANKRLVYDFWREVMEANHLELAPKYLAENLLQHSPNVPNGREGLVKLLSLRGQPQSAIEPRIKSPLVAIVAEGELVIMSFVYRRKDPRDPSKEYTSTWFDMSRVVDGKIVEHWDSLIKG